MICVSSAILGLDENKGLSGCRATVSPLDSFKPRIAGVSWLQLCSAEHNGRLYTISTRKVVAYAGSSAASKPGRSTVWAGNCWRNTDIIQMRPIPRKNTDLQSGRQRQDPDLPIGTDGQLQL
jgi:hypothetical protein